MGKEGINILNDVVYITYFIMGSIAGKSREYCAGRADVPLQSAEMGGERGNCTQGLKMLCETGPCIVKGMLPVRMRLHVYPGNVPVRRGGMSERTSLNNDRRAGEVFSGLQEMASHS
jgi:hypothetical protein